MSNLQTLIDAFAELERQADVTTANLPADPVLPTATSQRRNHLLLVAASIVAVVSVAGGVLAFAHGSGGSGSEAVAPPTTHMHSAGGDEPFQIPETSDELASRFRTVLGDTATFTVTDSSDTARGPVHVTVGDGNGHLRQSTAPPMPNSGESNGAAIVGTLTASGVTGGFDLSVARAAPGAKLSDNSDMNCVAHIRADGAEVMTCVASLAGSSDGVTYSVDLIRPDGVEFVMHISNERNPKGASKVLAPQPPLTTDQMVDIVTSYRW